MRAAALSVFLIACAGTAGTGGAASSSPSPAPTHERTTPIAVGERITPIAGPLAIPVKGAKLTMVNYFASWCHSSKRWMPHVEEMRKKYAASGLAVVGVANYDDASLESLEAFVKESGASFPISADRDRKILYTLPPRGWGQQIIVVDAQGVVRLVHRGTQEGAFESVDAEVGRLLAQ